MSLSFIERTARDKSASIIDVGGGESTLRLKTSAGAVLDAALDIGFGDISNFNHAFRAEFGASPQAYRLRTRAYTKKNSTPSGSQK